MLRKILIILFLIVFAFILFKFYEAKKRIELHNRKYGYKMPCSNCPDSVFERGKWTGIIVSSDINYTDGAHNLEPFDIDNDRNIELIANAYRSDNLLFYKLDKSQDVLKGWIRYDIDLSVGEGNPRTPILKFLELTIRENILGGYTGGAHYTAVADLDNDGNADLIEAGDKKRYDIVWYKNQGIKPERSNWKKKYIYSNDSHRTYHVEAGDIDGDSYNDIVFTTKTDNSIGWLRNPQSSNNWKLTWIKDKIVRCFNAEVFDIDLDGKSDIIASEDDTETGGKLHLFTYIKDPMIQKEWQDNIIAKFPKSKGVSVFKIIDIDYDDDLDIVTANHQGDVFILKNGYPNGTRGEWFKYQVNNPKTNSHHVYREIDVGDIDLDGDYDIIVADEGMHMIVWFENVKNTFTGNWQKHIIDQSDIYLNWCHSVRLADIDRDGDLDIAVAAAGSNTYLIYKNNIINKKTPIE